MHTQIEVPLSKLKIDPANVRKTDRAPTEQFISSIREEGVLEALTVRKNGEGYLVTNGGKRLSALVSLVKEGSLKGDVAVPCVVRDGDDKSARNISLAVNYMREDMHEVDQYEAFADLLGDGMVAADIQKRYGLTKREFDQVIALGQLAPVIREAWRKEEVEEEAARAFTLEPDQKKQAELFAKLRKNHGLNAWTVKKAIIGDDQHLAGMTALLRAEGWKWVELQSDLPQNAQWWDSKGKNAVKSEDRGKFGVIVAINYHGHVEIKYGVQKPAEKTAADKKAGTAKTGAAGEPAPVSISAALCGRLSDQITCSAAAVIETDPHLALASLAASITCYEGPVCIGLTTQATGLVDHDLEFDKQLALFRKKSAADLLKIVAGLVAKALNIGGSSQNALPMEEGSVYDRSLLEALDCKKLNAQLRANFDAADYFAGVTAQACKDAIALCDPKQPITGKEKKSELAALAAELVKKSNAGGKAGYLPPEMRTAHYDGPAPKSAKAKATKVAKKKAR